MREIAPDRIIVFTRGDGDGPQIHSRVVINGHEVPSISKVTVVAQGGDFAMVTLEAAVNEIKFVPLGSADWGRDDLSGFEP